MKIALTLHLAARTMRMPSMLALVSRCGFCRTIPLPVVAARYWSEFEWRTNASALHGMPAYIRNWEAIDQPVSRSRRSRTRDLGRAKITRRRWNTREGRWFCGREWSPMWPPHFHISFVRGGCQLFGQFGGPRGWTEVTQTNSVFHILLTERSTGLPTKSRPISPKQPSQRRLRQRLSPEYGI